MFKRLFVLFIFYLSAVWANPSCPVGTKPSKNDPNICYLFEPTPKSFYDAEAACVAEGGHLTPVFDQFTNLMITAHANEMFKNSTDFWIGGHVNIVNSALIWLWTWHYSFLKYTDWGLGEPSRYDNGSCTSVKIATASWSSNDCNLKKPYVCQFRPIVFICEDGWTFLEETKMCYKMFSRSSSFDWVQANELCQSQNASLISIHSDVENTLLGKLTTNGIKLNEYAIGVWIGLIHSTGTWTWSDHSPFDYQNWGKNDPDWIGKSNCVVFYPDGASDSFYSTYIMKWDTTECQKNYYRTVCQKSAQVVRFS